MKIAFIYDVIYPYVKGGAEKRNWELASRLNSRGHEVHLFGMKSWEGPGILLKKGVYLHGVCKFHNLYLKSGIRNPFVVIYFTVCLIPALLKDKFDLIDCNAFPYLPFFMVGIISRIKRAPLLVTWQEVWGDYWYDYLGYFWGWHARLIEKIVIRLSEKSIVHSLKVKRALIHNGVNPQDITVIAHGIDRELIKNAPISSLSLDLIFAGRLIKEKNLNLIIDSLGEIKKALPAVKCLIIGEGPEKDRLIRLRDKLGLGDNLIFKDFLPYQELISLMKSARVFIFPSQREGFGIVILEAMACGLPVIALEHPMSAATEFIRSGQNGLICTRADFKELASLTLSLLKNEAARQKMAQCACESVEGYDWEKITDFTEKLYCRLAGKER